MTPPPKFFPDKPYAITLTPDAVLQKLLEDNIKKYIKYTKNGSHIPMPRARVPFSVILISTDGKHKYAGVDDDALFYSASLLKVGVMYAAFELVAAANRFLASAAFTGGPDFFAKFDTALQGALKTTRPEKLRDKPVAGAPDLRQILSYNAGASPFIDMDPAFFKLVDKMIVPSDDVAAGTVIDAIGYAYIHEALRMAGLSQIERGKNRNVIWVSGDYSAVPNHFVTLYETENDGHAKLAMNTRGMARLGALLQNGDMTDRAPDSPVAGIDRSQPDRAAMLTMLQRAKSRQPEYPIFDSPFITRDKLPIPFSILHNKLGQGPIGPDPSVSGGGVDPEKSASSELSILSWTGIAGNLSDIESTAVFLTSKGLTGHVIVCWQNYRHFFAATPPFAPQSFQPISEVVIDTVEKYLES